MSTFTAPALDLEAFHCPHCHSFSHQTWGSIHWQVASDAPDPIDGWKVCLCQRCKKFSLWIYTEQVFPGVGNIPDPNPDMPNDIRLDYIEAAGIYSKSPRGAAALLRLCIDKLVHQHLGKRGSINDAIGQLVREGLSTEVQQALDIVRVIGNEAVHPGSMDLRDDHQTALSLFGILNYIIDDRIARPKKLSQLFGQLPQGTKIEIAKRDAKK